ncbi:MAG TPA: adenylate/guanylate cyclase domain-containing protein [Cyclobacteriaceae bacterium]
MNSLCRFLFLFSFCLTLTAGQAQNIFRELDSLKSALFRESNDSAKVDILNELGTRYLSQDVYRALDNGKKAQNLAKTINYRNGEAFALKLLGQGHASNGNYQEAINSFKASLALFESTHNKDGIANILNNLGSIYFLLGDDAKSIEYHLQSLKVAEEINNKVRIATNLNNLGTVYLNKPATANRSLVYFLRALPIFEEIEYDDGIGIVSGNIGEIYFNRQQYDSALTYFNTYVTMYEGMPDAAWGLSYIGQIYANQNDFDQAFKFHEEAVSIARDFDSKLDLAQSLLSLASTKNKKNDFPGSVASYRQALEISEEIKARQEIKKAYEGLTEQYAKLNDFKNAYIFSNLLIQIKDTLYNTNEDKKIQQLQFNFDIEKKESEIDLLTKDQALKEATIQRQKIVNYAAGITGFLLLLVILGTYNRYRYVRKTNKIIKDERDRSQELLLNILPEETARELETDGHAQTRYYENVTVLFTDFKGFSSIAGKLSPQDLVAELNDYFVAFDEIVDKYNLEKIKTIGDAYMCAGGIPTANETNPLDAVEAALEMQVFMKNRIAERIQKGLVAWELRIGIHTGPIVAGVVGKKKYAYDIWGDTVNVASRMESNSEPGKVNISSATFEKIKSVYDCDYRGKISAKNIGEVDMFFVGERIATAVSA